MQLPSRQQIPVKHGWSQSDKEIARRHENLKISREQTELSLQYLRETHEYQSRSHSAPEFSKSEFMAILERCDDHDDVRSALVSELARELRNSTYEVPSDWVAEKLVGRLVSDRLR